MECERAKAIKADTGKRVMKSVTEQSLSSMRIFWHGSGTTGKPGIIFRGTDSISPHILD